MRLAALAALGPSIQLMKVGLSRAEFTGDLVMDSKPPRHHSFWGSDAAVL